MPSVSETFNAKGQMAADLAEGVNTLSGNQTVTFTKYIKLVLPLDGFVFWVKADLVSPSAMYNSLRFNGETINSSPDMTVAASSFAAEGSLHYSSAQQQNEDDNMTLNKVVFTSLGPINDLNDIGATVMYIGQIDEIRFAFSERGSFYRQTGLYHYRGDAIYPVMETQIIDDVASLNTLDVIVSNSLPIWLTLNKFMPMYPAYLVPDNLPPPYAAVYIRPEDTVAIQGAPYIDQFSSHYQLVSDRVRIIMYGLRNNQALDFQDYVFQATLNTDLFGIMTMPVIQDDHRQQNELGILAQKKIFDVKINYYQTRVQDLARQYILSCIPTFIFLDQPLQ